MTERAKLRLDAPPSPSVAVCTLLHHDALSTCMNSMSTPTFHRCHSDSVSARIGTTPAIGTRASSGQVIGKTVLGAQRARGVASSARPWRIHLHERRAPPIESSFLLLRRRASGAPHVCRQRKRERLAWSGSRSCGWDQRRARAGWRRPIERSRRTTKKRSVTSWRSSESDRSVRDAPSCCCWSVCMSSPA